MRRVFGVIAAAALCLLSMSAEAAKPSPSGKNGKQETVITSNRLEYDYAESAVLFEENVRVEDAQYTMTADRVIVLLDGTNDVRQIRALGHVVIINGDRSARCPEAIYTKATGQIVLSGKENNSVQLSNKDDTVNGRKITIWLNDQRMICEPARARLIDANPATVTGKDKNGDAKRVLP